MVGMVARVFWTFGTNNTQSFAAVFGTCPGDGTVTAHYSASWYNTLSVPSSGSSSWAPSAGDLVKLTVGPSAITITDVTQNEILMGPGFRSASPSGGGCVLGTMNQPQPKYNVIRFVGCTATVGGATNPIGNFGSGVALYDEILTNIAGTTIIAEPSHLSNTGNFNIFHMASRA